MKIGIYGGTFSPPHLGHVRAAELFIRERALDELHIIPAGMPPHKQEDGRASSDDRLAMCRLAFAHLPEVKISDREILREGKSYTVLTLREYAREGIRPELLIGTDMMLSFEKWYCFEEILRLCTLVCIPRESDGRKNDELTRMAERLTKRHDAEVVFLSGRAVEASSSELRDCLKEHREATLLSDSVAEYIRRRGLYGVL